METIESFITFAKIKANKSLRQQVAEIKSDLLKYVILSSVTLTGAWVLGLSLPVDTAISLLIGVIIVLFIGATIIIYDKSNTKVSEVWNYFHDISQRTHDTIMELDNRINLLKVENDILKGNIEILKLNNEELHETNLAMQKIICDMVKLMQRHTDRNEIGDDLLQSLEQYRKEIKDGITHR